MRKKLGLRLSVGLIVAATAAVAATAMFAGGAFSGTGSTGCPSLSGKQAATDINATFTDNGGGNATYSIDTPSDSSSAGVPGLIKYCVFTTVPDSAAADYPGWTSAVGSSDFAFARPDGNVSNIPFDGTTGVDVGNATWNGGTVPDAADQTILLHINDPTECNDLYGDNPGTCWVLPNGAPSTGAADLVVSKDAFTSLTETYGWDSKKSVTPTNVNTTSSTVTAHYTVMATWSGPTPSGWTVSGHITVQNPNGFDVTGVTITDAVGAHDCSVTDANGGLDETVAADDSLVVPYSCSWATAPSSTGTNTATATWDKDAFGTPTGSAQGTADFDFADATVTPVNDSTTVQDTFNGGSSATNIADVNVNGTYSNVASGVTPSYNSGTQTFTFTYSRVLTVVPDACTTYPNTVALTGITDATPLDNSASVRVCGPVAGGLTMGFWQNNNGQAIIKAGASTATVCNSGTWLRQYAPFQDLSSTATCAQVATYVYNIIKGGGTSCGGANCNTLLKAQTLATALNVYFSDPTLSGNPIHAPSPLGGVNVNLTSWSAAFGSTCESVSQMLTDAASHSNVGGSSWYGQVKATQVLAKSAFDAINNQVAFTC
jgi:hypothetical protein